MRRLVAWCGGALLCAVLAGCGRSSAELGEVVEHMPRVPGTETPYHLPSRILPTAKEVEATPIPSKAPEDHAYPPDALDKQSHSKQRPAPEAKPPASAENAPLTDSAPGQPPEPESGSE